MENINWEKRRYELAKAAMGGFIAAIWASQETGKQFSDAAERVDKNTTQAIAGLSLIYADEMIKQLRKD